MKPSHRSRNMPLAGIKGTEALNLETPSKIPASRFIIRAHKRSGDMSEKIIEDHRRFSHQQSPNETNEEGEYIELPLQSLDARDRRTISRYEFSKKKFNLEDEQEKLDEWLGQMHFKVVSSSFNLYLSEELTFEQVKVHCCQNLLLNILNFLESLTENSDNSLYTSRTGTGRECLSYWQMKKLLQHINQVLTDNLAYMQIKYPLTKDSKPNKALQGLIKKIDNLGNDDHDIISKSEIEFTYKEGGNYTSEIMRFINFLISKQSKPYNEQKLKEKSQNVVGKQVTYFQLFYETMEKLFTSVYKYQNSNDNPAEEAEETKEQKQYKEKVMKYTHYLIGQKISSNTQEFLEEEISAELFGVKSPSILRILTKWTEQLEKKIMNAQQQILKRPFRFKRNKSTQYSKLNANQKNDLYQEAIKKAAEIEQFKKQLSTNYNQIEAMLSSHLRQGSKYKNIPKSQYKVGFFCSKIQAAASSTLLSYLNKIIHILLLIPQQLKKRSNKDDEYKKNIDINLITFKISDLFRCKIKSREAQIIRIFKQIEKISLKGEPFKIVRIKDRLSQGTRDIMVNVLFKGIFLCQIQLAIEESVESKQQLYDSFSHFLYELHRSRLGPIMESACTWAQFDQRVKIFRQINDCSGKQLQLYIEHACGKEFFIMNQYPFVCTLCQKFYSSQIGFIQHKKCGRCKEYYECSVCRYNKMSQQEISDLIKLNYYLEIFKSDFCLWKYDQNNQKTKNLPLFGLIISKKMKKPQIIFFQTIIFKYDAYIIQLKYKQEETSYKQIEKLQTQLQKQRNKIKSNYDKSLRELQSQIQNHQKTKDQYNQAKQLLEKQYQRSNEQTNQKFDVEYFQKTAVDGKFQLVVIEKIAGNTPKQIKAAAEKYIIYQWKEQRAINKKITSFSMKNFYQIQDVYVKNRIEANKNNKIAQQKKLKKKFEQRREKLVNQFNIWKSQQTQQTQPSQPSQPQPSQQVQQQRLRRLSQSEQLQQPPQQLQIQPPQSQEQPSQQQRQSQNPHQQEEQPPHQYQAQPSHQKQIQPQQEKENKYVEKIKLNKHIFQDNIFLEVRVIEKQSRDPNYSKQRLLLGIYLEQYIIRNKLKQMNNQSTLQNLSTSKIEVLFMEDEFIQNEINEIDSIVTINSQQLNQIFSGINEVYFDNNYIEDLHFLQRMDHLKVAHFSHNNISDLTPLEVLSNLTELQLEDNKISQLNGLTNKKQLLELNLNRNQLQELTFFDSIGEGELGKLKIFYASDNNIISMNGIEKLVSLVKLDLSFNYIEQIPLIEKLQCVQELDLSGNQIKKMNQISNFPNLKRLQLNNNQISIISKDVAQLYSLSILNMRQNKIKKIKNLPASLTRLNLSHNKIQKMKGLDNFEALQQLLLSDNEIQSITSYAKLTKLSLLDLSFNSIQQLKQDVVNYLLQVVQTVNLNSNILNDTQDNRKNLSSLKAKFGNIFVKFKRIMI